MFGLIRRISYSVIPRPDRPWEDDPTSNAPNTRRKRRISSIDRDAMDDDEEQGRKKKIRGDSESVNPGSDDNAVATPDVDASGVVTSNVDGDEGEVTVHREGSLEVKVVTKRVKDVDLDDGEPGNTEATTPEPQPDTKAPDAATESESDAEPTAEENAVVQPESIPLPEEKDGELDELRSSPPTPQEDITSATNATASEPAEAPTETPPEAPSSPGARRRTRAAASPRKMRSKSPKKVSARA